MVNRMDRMQIISYTDRRQVKGPLPIGEVDIISTFQHDVEPRNVIHSSWFAKWL